MESKLSKTILVLIVELLLTGAIYDLSAQNIKKAYSYIQKGEIEKAHEELGKLSDNDKGNGIDLTLYSLANCLVLCDEAHDDFNPYKSLEDYSFTYKVWMDREEVNRFLHKYNLSLDIIQERIYQSIYREAKKNNSEESYKSALKVCNGCFYEQEFIKLMLTSAYNEAKKSNTLKGYSSFLDSYPNSEYSSEIQKLLEQLAFLNVKSNLTVSSLDSYISYYSNPSNEFIPIAFHLRDSIALAQTDKTYNRYLDYIRKYPNSEYVFEVKERLPELLLKQASNEENVDLFELFIYEYPNDSRKLYAEAQIESLLYQKLMNNRSSEEFLEFRRRFPNSKYINELEANIEGEYEYFTDSRDNKVYKTIRMGNQIWMAENLRYDGVEHVPTPNNIHDESNRRVSKDEYSKVYGESYSFRVSQNVCPIGWHLPSKEEWEELFIHVNRNAYKESVDETRLATWYEIGDYLINRQDFSWFCSEQSFQSKFNVLATGDFDIGYAFSVTGGPQVINKGLMTNFWTSTRGARGYQTVSFSLGTTKKSGACRVVRTSIHDEGLGSQFVRCVKDR